MYHIDNILSDAEVRANIYCKSRNLPNVDTQPSQYRFAVTSGSPCTPGYLYQTVCKTKVRTCEGNKDFLDEPKFKFQSAFDVNKCLKQIELTNLLDACAPILTIGVERNHG